jgi:hypothetical protein
MQEVTGVVESLEARESNSGGQYVIVRLVGVESGFFDWTSQVAASLVREGDEVVVEHDGGKYPRIEEVTVLKRGSGGPKKSRTAATGAGAAEANGKPNGRDTSIVRQTCLKAAACLLASCSLEPEARATEAIKVAERMESWVLR